MRNLLRELIRERGSAGRGAAVRASDQENGQAGRSPSQELRT